MPKASNKSLRKSHLHPEGDLQSLGKQEVNKSREKEGFNQILQALATKMGDEDKCQMICDPKPRVQTSIQASL